MNNDLQAFLNEPHCDLGPNAQRLYELILPMKNARFMDLGVRLGPSSAIMSVDAKEKNNKVHGVDVHWDGFQTTGARFGNEDYMCYLADSVTLGKTWDEEPFDVIFVDTLHTREFVLAELYFWINHLKEGGYLVFHDTHLVNRGDYVIGDVCFEAKSTHDFLASIMSKRLWTQLDNMDRCYKTNIVIIYGSLGDALQYTSHSAKYNNIPIQNKKMFLTNKFF